MLNRLFIVVGMLAILALTAAFVVPRFINWGDYRERLETAASEAFGTKVEILGNIDFALLPQPELTFSQVAVGPPGKPVLSIAGVHAQFSLVDFLRDQYTVTTLLLESPRLEIGIGPDGAIDTPLVLAEQVSDSNITIEDARLESGVLHLSDARSKSTFSIEEIVGELRLADLRGPFSFQGVARHAGEAFEARLSLGATAGGSATPLSFFLQPADRTFALSAEGAVTTDVQPRFVGDLVFRQRPVRGPDVVANDVRGDWLITSKIEAATDQVLFPAYTILPDENRVGTRLTGAAVLKLGADAAFDAVVSGGVLALPPRDATAEAAVVPYELVRLLGEVGAPPKPLLPGRIGVAIAEMNLRALSLRDVHFDIVARGEYWALEDFGANLAGNTKLTLEGRLSSSDGRPSFTGDVSLTSRRLDTLAMLWRRPLAPNPLFNLAGAYSARVELSGDTLSLPDGRLTLGGAAHPISIEIGVGESRRLDVVASLGALDVSASAALAALLPDAAGNGQFAVTFPRGSVAASADAAQVFGLDGRALALAARWEGGVLEVEELSAGELGGARFSLAATAFGTMARPEVSGTGSLRVDSASAPALALLLSSLGTPQPVRDFIARAVPADLAFELDPPGRDGGQSLRMAGRAGIAQLNGEAVLTEGLARVNGSRVGLRIDLVSADAGALFAQLGLGALSLPAHDGPTRVTASADGTPSNSLETTLLVESGEEAVQFAGNIIVTDPLRWTGRGVVTAALTDPGALAAALGINGIHLGPVRGTADFDFAGLKNLRLTRLDVRSGGQRVQGSLALNEQGTRRTVSGELDVGAVPIEALGATIVGPDAFTATAALWPSGPLAANDQRATNGRVRISADAITSGDVPILSETQFELDWDAESIRIRGLDADVEGGRIVLNAGLCCSGPLSFKTLSARVSLEAVPVSALLPGTGLGGIASASARFDAGGESIAAMIKSLSGEGSYAVEGLTLDRFDPGAFAAAGSIDDIVGIEPDAMAGLIRQALARGAFEAPVATGSFTVAGGVLRSPNFAVETADARLFGGSTVHLSDLALEGAYALTPLRAMDEAGLVNATTAEIVARLDGTLRSPQSSFDVASMVDAIKVRAYEIELIELERLRAEDEARARAIVEERAALAAREARTAAEEALLGVAAQKDALDGADPVGSAAGLARRAADGVFAGHQAVVDRPSPAALPAERRVLALGAPKATTQF